MRVGALPTFTKVRGVLQNSKHGCPWPPSPTSERMSSTEAGPLARVCAALVSAPCPGFAAEDGPAFLERVKGRDDFDQLPILIMSAKGIVLPSNIPTGVVGILQKPIELDELLSVLDEHCPPSPFVGRLDQHL